MTLKTLKFDKRTMMFCLLMLVWADAGITYFGLMKVREKDPANWMNHEASVSISPMIKKLGLTNGILLGAFINSIIILFIAIIYPIEFTYGFLTGIFFLALIVNMRLVFAL
jgi:hypothetical protein